VLTMAFNNIQSTFSSKWRTSNSIYALFFGTFVENNWIILHLHHTRFFCEPINQVALEIFWFLFKASRLQAPLIHIIIPANCKVIALSVITNHSLQLKGNSPIMRCTEGNQLSRPVRIYPMIWFMENIGSLLSRIEIRTFIPTVPSVI
jgi:hypothetical protein